MTYYRSLFYFVGTLLVFTACNSNSSERHHENAFQSTALFASQSHHVNGENKVAYASGFQLGQSKGFPLITVSLPPKSSENQITYLLYPREQKPPPVSGADTDTLLIPVPLQRMIIFSTTHAAMLAELDAADVVIGMGESEWVVNQDYRSRLKQGTITALPGAKNLEMEQIIALEPDAVMMIGQFANQSSKMQKLKRLGIPVIINAEWLEQTPLGRAEWIKMMGRLVGKKDRADSYFNDVATEYKRLNRLTTPSTIHNKPKVLMNLSFKDQWYVPGGNSYMAELLRDAGADYPWYHTEETGGIPMSFEEIYQIGLKADIWLNPGAASTKEEILATDQRLRKFKPYINNSIYNITKWKGEGGGYAFWERGVVHPEEILADLTKILHPELLPNHELIYYEKVH